MKLRSVFFSAAMVTLVWWATSLGGPEGGPLTAPRPAAVTTGQVEHVVVQPGDTLWAIARRAQPEGDLRPLVDVLTESRGNRPLQVGEEIAVPVG